MKHLASIFLTITKIIDFILIAATVGIGILLYILGNNGLKQYPAGSQEYISADLMYKIAIILFVIGGITLLSLIFAFISHSRLLFSKRRYGGKSAGVFAILSGIFGFPFLGIPAGIIILAMNNKEYKTDKE